MVQDYFLMKIFKAEFQAFLLFILLKNVEGEKNISWLSFMASCNFLNFGRGLD